MPERGDILGLFKDPEVRAKIAEEVVGRLVEGYDIPSDVAREAAETAILSFAMLTAASEYEGYLVQMMEPPPADSHPAGWRVKFAAELSEEDRALANEAVVTYAAAAAIAPTCWVPMHAAVEEKKDGGALFAVYVPPDYAKRIKEQARGMSDELLVKMLTFTAAVAEVKDAAMKAAYGRILRFAADFLLGTAYLGGFIFKRRVRAAIRNLKKKGGRVETVTTKEFTDKMRERVGDKVIDALMAKLREYGCEDVIFVGSQPPAVEA